MAGVSRLQYTTDTRLIRVMCSGRVDSKHIVRAFANGADGVFIGGCRLNECNYLTHGNYQALNTVRLCKKIMEYIGLSPERLRVEFMSAGDGIHFAEVLNDFGNQITELGPLGTGEGIDNIALKPKLEEVNCLIPYIKMVKKEQLRGRRAKEPDHDELFSLEEIDQLFSEAVSFYIDPEKCQACMICLRKCYVDAIIGGKDRIHVIDQEKCIKCGTCFNVCPANFGAVQELFKQPVPLPIPEAERTIIREHGKIKV